MCSWKKPFFSMEGALQLDPHSRAVVLAAVGICSLLLLSRALKNYLLLSINDRPRSKGRSADSWVDLGKGRREQRLILCQVHVSAHELPSATETVSGKCKSWL